MLGNTGQLEGEAAEKALRHYEATTLDRHHESLRLWRRPPGQALYGILSAFDSLFLIAGPVGARAMAFNTPSWAQNSMAIEDGLTYSCRWLCRGNPVKVGSHGNDNLLEEAGEFLMHARAYSLIADQHMEYGHGHVGIVVDEERKVIRFCPQPSNESRAISMLDGFHQARDAWNSGQNFGAAMQEVVAKTRATPYRLTSGRIVLEDLSSLKECARSMRLRKEVLAECELDIDDEADLEGFLLADFRSYWWSLHLWSFAACGRFLNLVRSGGADQWECLPTQVVRRNRFLHAIAGLSGLSLPTVSRITKRLAFPFPNKKADILMTPLLVSGNTVAWSPRRIIESRSERNLLKVMARESAFKHIAANIIGDMERPLTAQLSKLLESQGWRCREFVQLGDGRGELDLVAWRDDIQDELLVVEVKAVLEPGETNEMATMTKTLVDAQVQVRQAYENLNGFGQGRKSSLLPGLGWETVRSAYLVVLTEHSLPHGGYDWTEIPATSLRIIERRFKKPSFESPRAFWHACRELPGLPKVDTSLQRYDSIKVGPLTYEIPLETFAIEDPVPAEGN